MECAGRVTLTLVLLAAATVAGAQGREYRVEGAIVGSAQQPIAGAVLEIRERTTRRAFRITSDTNGRFKMVGLSHGTYEVTITMAGYRTSTHEWDLSEPRDTMKKVDLGRYVLLSDREIAARERSATLQEQFEAARELVRKGETVAARPLLERLHEELPNDTGVRFLLALCHLQNGEPAPAVGLLRQVIETDPTLAAAHVNLGICHEQLGDAEHALASYDAGLAIDRGNAIALYNAGVLHYNASDAARALPYFEKLLAVAPDDDRALEMAGYCELQLAAYAKALAYLERARPRIADPARAAAIDEIIAELRRRAAAAPGDGGR